MSTKLLTKIAIACLLLLPGCTHQKSDIYPEVSGNTRHYLPENMAAFNDDGTISARYVDPTLRYDHGILGDKVEAGGLLVIWETKEFYYRLDEAFVFEDLRPRLKDLDNDGIPEIITIQTSLQAGASVCVYKTLNGRLAPVVQSNYIGQSYRWLNIAAIDDLDNDGKVEIAWIQTPHIGGILKIARIEKDSLKVLDAQEGVSNHQIGSGNLCLSAVTVLNNQKFLFVPNSSHSAIIAFRFHDDQLIAQDTIFQNIDPTIPLHMQIDFQNLSEDKNCIYFIN